MKNELLTIGPFVIHGYGLMIAIGIISADLVSVHRAKRMNLDEKPIYALSLWCLLGGILGAKLLYILTQLGEILQNPRLLFDVSNGFVVYGGIIGGVLAGLLYCKAAKLDFLQYANLLIPSVALAQGFGRIGCLFAGCCYGCETTGPFGIVFHHSLFAPNEVRLVPTQIISSGLDFLNFLVLVLIARKRPDKVLGFYLTFYSMGRFVLEFYRGDLIRGSIGQLSTSQFISIFMMLAGIVMILVKPRSKSGNVEGLAQGTDTAETPQE